MPIRLQPPSIKLRREAALLLLSTVLHPVNRSFSEPLTNRPSSSPAMNLLPHSYGPASDSGQDEGGGSSMHQTACAPPASDALN